MKAPVQPLNTNTVNTCPENDPNPDELTGIVKVYVPVTVAVTDVSPVLTPVHVPVAPAIIRSAPLEKGSVAEEVNCTEDALLAAVIFTTGGRLFKPDALSASIAVQSASPPRALTAKSASIWESSQMRGWGLSAQALWAARRSGIRQEKVRRPRNSWASGSSVGQQMFWKPRCVNNFRVVPNMLRPRFRGFAKLNRVSKSGRPIEECVVVIVFLWFFLAVSLTEGVRDTVLTYQMLRRPRPDA